MTTYTKAHETACAAFTPQIISLLYDVAYAGAPQHNLVTRARELIAHIAEMTGDDTMTDDSDA
jgi:hypothetical protein